jgi:hypothetical protein
MSLLRASSLVFSLLFAPVAIGVASQNQSAATSLPNSPLNSTSKPVNLKVLPKDISRDDLNKLMFQYQKGLGQSCTFCHTENPETKQIDYASDENPMKNTARIMILMTSDLNTKYLAQVGDRRYAEPFTCGNCHLGQMQPPPFE